MSFTARDVANMSEADRATFLASLTSSGGFAIRLGALGEARATASGWQLDQLADDPGTTRPSRDDGRGPCSPRNSASHEPALVS